MTDAEVVTLCVAQAVMDIDSDREFQNISWWACWGTDDCTAARILDALPSRVSACARRS